MKDNLFIHCFIKHFFNSSLLIAIIILCSFTYLSNHLINKNIFNFSVKPQVSDPESYKDVSSMFNERGFYKSNGFSFDEQEMLD